MRSADKKELFERLPVPQALATMAIPTIISQMINLVYNVVDAWFIGRTGNAYMMAATTLTLTLVMMNTALSNLFGIGGGSLIARLMGAGRPGEARKVSAFAFYGSIGVALLYALLVGCLMDPLLRFLGASAETLDYARQYTLLVIILGAVPGILSMTLAHMLRNAGQAGKASIGLSGGGILNVVLDPLFMFVLLPAGQEVTGAALATLLSNTAACLYLLYAFRGAGKTAPLSMSPAEARGVGRTHVKGLLAVGVPSAILTGLFDLANVCVNMAAAAHDDFVLAGMGIVLKVDRVPNAVNLGICQGMLPIVAYNYASGNRERMRRAIHTARLWGLIVSGASIALFQLFAESVTRVFLNTSGAAAQNALLTTGYAALFLRIRSLASPFQLINYHSSYCMQAMGNGRGTMLHAAVRELVFYIPMIFLLDRLFGERGLAAALIAGECLGAVVALILLHRTIKAKEKQTA